MDHLRISTITSILQISSDIDLKKIYDSVPITKYIPFIEYGAENLPKGFSKKMLRKKRKKTKKKIFYNQATLHVVHDNKIMNVKLFNNGKIQITGLKKEDQGIILIQNLIQYFQNISIFDKEVSIVDHKLVLINSDFDIGFEINREILHQEIIDSGIYSSYEPCNYPGVNIKYYMNPLRNNFGICDCEKPCNGKGKDNSCKRITIAVFKSGKIIITGGRNKNQIQTSYEFITDFINENRDEILVQK